MSITGSMNRGWEFGEQLETVLRNTTFVVKQNILYFHVNTHTSKNFFFLGLWDIEAELWYSTKVSVYTSQNTDCKQVYLLTSVHLLTVCTVCEYAIVPCDGNPRGTK